MTGIHFPKFFILATFIIAGKTSDKTCNKFHIWNCSFKAVCVNVPLALAFHAVYRLHMVEMLTS